eukprot:1097627-Prymnesium_polylepis.1
MSGSRCRRPLWFSREHTLHTLSLLASLKRTPGRMARAGAVKREVVGTEWRSASEVDAGGRLAAG